MEWEGPNNNFQLTNLSKNTLWKACSQCFSVSEKRGKELLLSSYIQIQITLLSVIISEVRCFNCLAEALLNSSTTVTKSLHKCVTEPNTHVRWKSLELLWAVVLEEEDTTWIRNVTGTVICTHPCLWSVKTTPPQKTYLHCWLEHVPDSSISNSIWRQQGSLGCHEACWRFTQWKTLLSGTHTCSKQAVTLLLCPDKTLPM